MLFDWISPKVVSFLILGVFGEEIWKEALLDVFGAEKCGKWRKLKETLKCTKPAEGDGVTILCDGVMKTKDQRDGLPQRRNNLLNGWDSVTASDLGHHGLFMAAWRPHFGHHKTLVDVVTASRWAVTPSQPIPYIYRTYFSVFRRDFWWRTLGFNPSTCITDLEGF